ncbi:MAG TPA: hypothetical protein VKA36_11060 [Solirubrobacterales bacterium]|nr:hypothetical protein [Solirubrobacterales bacterium]
MSAARLRLIAALVPAGLLLHEGTYALSGGPRVGSHGYLELAVPLLVPLAGGLALASLLLPLIGATRGSSRAALTPFALAGGLIAVFAAQELIESLLFAGGLAAFGEALAAAWLLLPLALALGLLAVWLIEALDRTGELLLEAVSRRRPAGAAPDPAAPAPAWDSQGPAGLSPLAFGLARRPPPPGPARS